MSTIHRILVACIVSIAAIALSGCGALSVQALQSTITTAVKATSEAMRIATAVATNQIPEKSSQTCEPQALKHYATVIDSQLRAFTEQANLVDTVPRAGLDLALQRLLDLQTKMRKLVPPVCLSVYHERVINMMQMHQLAYQNIAAQGDQALTINMLTMATAELEKVQTELQQISTGIVPPTVTPTP